MDYGVKLVGGFTVDERQQLFLLALGECDGNVTTACEMASVSRSEYVDWLTTVEDFAHGVHEVAERILDNAEQHLQDAINDGNLTASIFFLKCKGKERGYIEREEARKVDTRPLSFEMHFHTTPPTQGQLPDPNVVDVTPEEMVELED